MYRNCMSTPRTHEGKSLLNCGANPWHPILSKCPAKRGDATSISVLSDCGKEGHYLQLSMLIQEQRRYFYNARVTSAVYRYILTEGQHTRRVHASVFQRWCSSYLAVMVTSLSHPQQHALIPQISCEVGTGISCRILRM